MARIVLRWARGQPVRSRRLRTGATHIEDGGDLLVIGSAELVKTLVDNDLADEYRIMIDPLVVG